MIGASIQLMTTASLKMVECKQCPICGEIVGEFEQKCDECGYNKVWEKDKENKDE